MLKFQINYTENDGPVNVINLYPEDYNSGAFLVDYRLSVNPKSSYIITIAGFNVRGIGAIFYVPEVLTPVDSKFLPTHSLVLLAEFQHGPDTDITFSLAPTSPTNVMATPVSPHRVDLTWDEPTYDGGNGIKIVA